MRNRPLSVLACCIGLAVGSSCTTRHAPSSAPQSPPTQAEAGSTAGNAHEDAALHPTDQMPNGSTPASAKEQELNNLTRRYMNDEISPREYQTERARILAEP